MHWGEIEEPARFDAYMTDVDRRLRERGVPIPSRPVHALLLISEELKTSFYSPSDRARRIDAWFDALYGERLKQDWSVGKMLVLLRGDPFVARFPLVIGAVRLNALQVIEGVTPAILEALPTAERDALVALLRTGCESLMEISAHRPSVQGIGWDLDDAVRQAMAGALGPSRWSCQQAVEKVLNAFVERMGGDLKRARKGGTHGHDFAPLATEARARGLVGLDDAVLARVACKTDVRYPGRQEARAVTVAQAVDANQAAVSLVAAVARQIPP